MKRVITLLMAVAVALAVSSVPAQAAVTDLGDGWQYIVPLGAQAKVQYDCPNSYACLWDDIYGYGARCQWTTTGLRGGKRIPSLCNNNTESTFNRTGYTITLYDTNDCDPGQPKRDLGRGDWQADWQSRSFSNRASSLSSVVNHSGGYC